jgi:hypothetical protein
MRTEVQPCPSGVQEKLSNGNLMQSTTAVPKTASPRNISRTWLPINATANPRKTAKESLASLRNDRAYALHARAGLGCAKPPGPLPCAGACLYNQGTVGAVDIALVCTKHPNKEIKKRLAARLDLEMDEH